MENFILKKEYIFLSLEGKTKEEVLKEIAKKALEVNVVSSADEYFEGLLERENEVTTGFGNGIAIPHARVDAVLKPALLVAKLNNKIDWKALDDNPVELILTIAMPSTNEGNLHLKILAELSRKLMHEEFVNKLLSSATENDLYNVLGGE